MRELLDKATHEAQELLQQAYRAKEELIQEAEPFLVELSCAIAEKVIERQLTVEPELMVELIRFGWSFYSKSQLYMIYLKIIQR